MSQKIDDTASTRDVIKAAVVKAHGAFVDAGKQLTAAVDAVIDYQQDRRHKSTCKICKGVSICNAMKALHEDRYAALDALSRTRRTFEATRLNYDNFIARSQSEPTEADDSLTLTAPF